MKLSLLLVILLVLDAHALQFAWDAPPNSDVSGYVLYQGTSSGNYSQLYNAGSGTNCTFTGSLAAGPNYFALAAFSTANGFAMTSLSNEAAVTNTPALLLSTVIFSSTNPAAGWQPWQTNNIVIYPDAPARFFRSGLNLSRTNIVLPPAP